MMNARKKQFIVRKLLLEILCLVSIALGIVVFVLAITKTIPGFDNVVEGFISILISYGIIIGPTLTALSVLSFTEVRNKRYPRRRTR